MPSVVVFIARVILDVCFSCCDYIDEMLNAMGSARLEIMEERDDSKDRETSPQKTVAPVKVGPSYLEIMCFLETIFEGILPLSMNYIDPFH